MTTDGGPALLAISFACRSATEALGRALANAGWQARAIDGARWLAEPQPCAGPVALLIADPATDAQAIVSALRRDRIVPALLLLSTELPRWDRTLTDCSEQLVSWPCEPRELELRLRAAAEPRPTTPADLAHLNLIGRSPSFRRALALTQKVARCDETVLIEGETGTGKELAARAVHYLSDRQAQPFVAVNCGAFPDNLIENELFGHCRGAYTDAKSDQPGLIAEAEGGTLFLDEVNSLSRKAQVTLLRFLQDRSYRPLGGRQQRAANVRVVAASNVKLAELAERGAFRADLYYRLNLLHIELPALRERRDDIELLCEHFLRQCQARYQQPAKSLHASALAYLTARDWPGNVRELEHFIHRQFLMCEGRVITIDPDPDHGVAGAPGIVIDGRTLPPGLSLRKAKERLIYDFEVWYLTQLLQQTGGNVTQAAARAGTERRALGKLIKRHKLEARRFARPQPS